jgi:hypothetical protein
MTRVAMPAGARIYPRASPIRFSDSSGGIGGERGRGSLSGAAYPQLQRGAQEPGRCTRSGQERIEPGRQQAEATPEGCPHRRLDDDPAAGHMAQQPHATVGRPTAPNATPTAPASAKASQT